MAYIEVLTSQKEVGQRTGLEGRKGSLQGDMGPLSPLRNFASVPIPPGVLHHVAELLGGYLWRTDLPALIKEFVFHLLAQTLRRMYACDSDGNLGVGGIGGGGVLPMVSSPQLSPSLALLMLLQTELRKLYDEESKHWSSSSSSSTGGATDQGRFSTYFHSLLELSLAVAEVTAPVTPTLPAAKTSGMSHCHAPTQLMLQLKKNIARDFY